MAFLLSPPTARCFNSRLLNTTHSLLSHSLSICIANRENRAGGLLVTQTHEIAPPTQRFINCRFINFLNPGGIYIYIYIYIYTICCNIHKLCILTTRYVFVSPDSQKKEGLFCYTAFKWLINTCKVEVERVLFEVRNSSSAAGPTNLGIRKISGTA